jgi:hypothetical protein
VADHSERLTYAARCSNRRLPQQSYFRGSHFPSLGGRMIVKPDEMKQSMSEIELKFVLQRRAKFAGLFSSRGHADENFAVMKRNHVGGPGLPQKLLVQPGHSCVRGKQNGNVRRKICGGPWPPIPRVQCDECALRELLKFRHVDPDLSLQIANSYSIQRFNG